MGPFGDADVHELQIPFLGRKCMGIPSQGDGRITVPQLIGYPLDGPPRFEGERCPSVTSSMKFQWADTLGVPTTPDDLP